MKAATEDHFQGKRLRVARTFHGLTLAELGEQVAASRQYIQRLESDPETLPSNELLLALAEVLRVRASFFFEPIHGELAEEECYFRRLKTTPINLRTRALSYGTMFNLILWYLVKYVELPPINIPGINVKDREDIERAAEKCRKHWGLHLDAPINNMTRTLESFGCVVTTFEGVSDKIDAFSYYRGRPIIVRSLDKGSTSRARFDLAHECGHIVMHNDFEVGNLELEIQANQFASAFLLPRVAFLQEFPIMHRLDWEKLFELKRRWGVSVAAIIRRAYDLNLISAVQYRNANVYISRNWRKRGEPLEPQEERIEILPAALETIRNEYGIEVADVAWDLGIDCSIIRKFGIECDESVNTTDTSKLVSINKYRNRKTRRA